MSGSRVYRFDKFVIDLNRLALIVEGVEVPLRPKAFDTLKVLAMRAGQVVTKDELVAAVWPDVIVNDDALAQCVRDVRKALGDDAQQVLRTIPRRGYMLAADVESVPQARSRPKFPAWAAVLVTSLVLLALAAYWFATQDDPIDPRAPRLTLVVLPTVYAWVEGRGSSHDPSITSAAP